MAPLLGLLGVLIGLLHAERSSVRALIAEKTRERERVEFEAKKEAMLETHNSLCIFQHFLGKMPSLPWAEVEKSTAFMDAARSLGRLHFFTSDDTIRSVIALTSLLGENYMELMKAKLPSMFTETDIKTANQEIESFEKMKQSFEDEIAAGVETQEARARIRKNITDISRKIASIYETRANAAGRHFQEVLTVSNELSARLPKITSAMAEILICARRELKFPINEKAYDELTRETSAAASRKLEEFNQHVRAEIERRVKENQ